MMRRSTKQEPRVVATQTSSNNSSLSGAYIRSLVKQLTSSTKRGPKGMMSKRDQDRKLTRPDDSQNQQQMADSEPGPPRPPHKKQVRRRLHTTRPYQERLLNMAEARREIVTALKYHRASMKQAQEQQLLRHHPPPIPGLQPHHQPLTDGSSIPLSPFPYSLSSKQNPMIPSWPIPSPLPPSSAADSLTLTLTLPLPTQPLGLSLNLQDFDNFYHKGSPPVVYSTPSPPPSSSNSSSSNSSAMTALSHEETGGPSKKPTMPEEAGRRRGQDEEDVTEKMRSVAERHQMEWNDRMNLVTSACWFEFLKGVEADIDSEEAAKKAAEERFSGGFEIFDEVMEFPPWLSGGESCLDQPHLVDDRCFSHDYFKDSALPCMDIGEIEGIDGDQWLS